MQKKFASKSADKNILIVVFNMQFYRMMNGEKVLEQALNLIKNRLGMSKSII